MPYKTKGYDGECYREPTAKERKALNIARVALWEAFSAGDDGNYIKCLVIIEGILDKMRTDHGRYIRENFGR